MSEDKSLTETGLVSASAGRPLKRPILDDDEECHQIFRLESIRDRTHLLAATAVLDHLLAQGDLSEDAEAYLGALTDLIETYERIHVTWPETTGIASVRCLMEDNGLTQSDMARLLDAPRSNISEILAGKRGLSKTHIQRLAAHFGLPADVFLDRQPVVAAE